MRTIKMTTGARVALDGDLLTLLETLYRELTAKRELERTFEDTVREIQTVIEPDDRRRSASSTSPRACSSTSSRTRTSGWAPISRRSCRRR